MWPPLYKSNYRISRYVFYLLSISSLLIGYYRPPLDSMLWMQEVTMKMSPEDLASLKDAIKRQKGGGGDDINFVEVSLALSVYAMLVPATPTRVASLLTILWACMHPLLLCTILMTLARPLRSTIKSRLYGLLQIRIR